MLRPYVYKILVLIAVCGFHAPGILAQQAGSSAYSQQNSLRVLDPQRWWSDQQGTIEEAVVSVRPKGIYTEYGLYLTFSARNTGFTAGTPLEVEFFFSLPDEAIVTDSWLWIGDDIIRAEIMDTWTASDIYEDIVDRRRDPSILFKRGQGQYELRVYPMDADSTRKVKITYLLPARWTAQHVQSVLPNHLLSTSRYPVEEFTVLTWPEDEWQDPFLLEREEVSFRADWNEQGEKFEWVSLSDRLTNGAITLGYPAPLQDGVFLSHKPVTANEGWYQLALQPFDIEGSEQKVLFLIDYDATKTNESAQSVLDAARSLLLTRFTAADSFNVMLSRLNIEQAADHWLPADRATVAATFEEMEDKIGNYSNLPALLNRGLEFVEERGPGARVLLISSSDQVGGAETANSLLDDVRASTDPLPPMFVVDLADRNLTSHYIGGRYFRGNEYFYTNLTKFSGGSYVHVRDGITMATGLERVFDDLSSTVGMLDLHTTLSDGFCYGRFALNVGDDGVVAADELVLQVGKYYGDFPFVAELSGLVAEQPVSKEIAWSQEEAFGSDSTLLSLWTGLQIQKLEQSSQTNEVIGEIVDYSLNNRILSLYTAFLALEVEQGGEVCASCEDETENLPSDIEPDEAGATDVQLEVYPNPFSDHVTVVLTLTAPVDAAEVSFEIYDIMGRRVRTLQPNQSGPTQRFELTWDGRDDAGQLVAAGTYLLVVTTPEGRHTRGLTFVR